MKEVLKQIEEHIDKCIAMGVLPRNYRESEDYKKIVREIENGD